jgi:ribonuclease VapC
VSSVVLDASAVLALLNNEPGANHLTPELLRNSVCSTVSLAEVQSKLVERGVPAEGAWRATHSSVQQAVPFNVEQAKQAGSLIAQTRPLGLSLGDRASLALALELKAPVYTADRSWKKLKLGVSIHVIR